MAPAGIATKKHYGTSKPACRNYLSPTHWNRYAASIPEVWIQDVTSDVLFVFREPRGKSYETSIELDRGATISPLAFPDARFSMTDLFGAP